MAFRQSLTLLPCLWLGVYSLHTQAAPPAPAAAAPAAPAVLPLEDLRTFTKAFEQIRSHYIKDVTDSQLLEYAIKGMLNELDPHSSYLNAEAFHDLQNQTSGEFGGIGIDVGQEDGVIKVISPIDDSPATRAGIQAGDLIIKIDDQTVKSLGVENAINKLRGEKGTKVTLTLMRKQQEKPLVLTLVRDTIQVRSLRSERLDTHYAYIRISQFQVKTGEELTRALKQLQQQPLKGAILDLRNNPGGVLNAAVNVADAFMEAGLIVYTQGRAAAQVERFNAQPQDLLNGLPLVVLINEGSASASEIVAGALQDSKRAIILGTRSFGKGSVQSVIPLSDSKALKLTTALYYTPNGRSIQAQGIEPDILVERAKITPIDTPLNISEAELGGHLANGSGEADVDANRRRKEGEAAKNGLLQKDNQLFEALNLLKGLNVYQQARMNVEGAEKR